MVETMNNVRVYLDDNPGCKEFLERILAAEDNGQKQSDEINVQYLGWESVEVSVPRKEIDPMLYAGIIKLQYKSSKYTNYVLVDREATRQALIQIDSETGDDTGIVKLPDDFLDIVELREDEKELITTALLAPEPVHVLMVGPPASAKSIILREIKRAFPRLARYTTGGAISKAGIEDYLIVNKPHYLCMDEVDYVPAHDQSPLLGLMEDQIVTRLKYGKRDTINLKCWVFGACNQSDRLIPALMSRFFTIYLDGYNRDEFSQVVRLMLSKREGISSETADMIANELSQFTTDPRDAVKIARLAKSCGNDMDKIRVFVRMMKGGKR